MGRPLTANDESESDASDERTACCVRLNGGNLSARHYFL